MSIKTSRMSDFLRNDLQSSLWNCHTSNIKADWRAASKTGNFSLYRVKLPLYMRVESSTLASWMRSILLKMSSSTEGTETQSLETVVI